MTTQTNMSMKDFAEYVRLPQSVLMGQKITEGRYNNSPCINIPYLNSKQQRIQTQVRLSINGSNKWAWLDYKRPAFYGLHRIPRNRKIDKLLIVEGATDVLVANYNNVLAVGVAGAKNFNPEMLADLPLDNIESFYILNEQDTGGESFIKSFENLIDNTTDFTSKCKVFNLGEHKDLLELWKSFNSEGITTSFENAIKESLEKAVALGTESDLFSDEVPEVDSISENAEIPDNSDPVPAESNSVNSVKVTPARKLDSLLYQDSLLGDIINKINPTTEANEHGLFAHLLAFAGHLVGGTPHIKLGAVDTFKANLFVAVIGKSGSAGRKGTSRKAIEEFLCQALDRDTINNGTVRGFGSGESLIKLLSYPTTEDEEGNETVMEIPQVIINIDEEFEKLINTKGRAGNTSQQIMQSAYDGEPLDRNNVSETNRAINYHFSYVGHITPNRMRHFLTNQDFGGLWSGFYSRYLFVETWKDKQIFEPMTIDWGNLLQVFKEQLEWARSQFQMTLATDSQKIFQEVKKLKSPVEDFKKDTQTLLEVLNNRYENHLLKLALIFALFDTARTAQVTTHHMSMALKFLESVERTIARTLQTKTGDPKADDLYSKIKAVGGSVSLAELYDLANSNKPTRDLYLGYLHQHQGNHFEMETTKTAGRPLTVWRIIE